MLSSFETDYRYMKLNGNRKLTKLNNLTLHYFVHNHVYPFNRQSTVCYSALTVKRPGHAL